VLVYDSADSDWAHVGSQAIERLVCSFDPARVGSGHQQDLIRLLNGHAASAVAAEPLHACVAHDVLEASAQRLQKCDEEGNFDLRLGCRQAREEQSTRAVAGSDRLQVTAQRQRPVAGGRRCHVRDRYEVLVRVGPEPNRKYWCSEIQVDEHRRSNSTEQGSQIQRYR